MGEIGWIRDHEPCTAHITAMISGSTWFSVAEMDRQVVGYARAMSDDVSVTYLVEVAVAEKYRRRGIGATLIQSCFTKFSHTAIYADVAPSAVKLVSRLGLTPRPAHLVACARSSQPRNTGTNVI